MTITRGFWVWVMPHLTRAELRTDAPDLPSARVYMGNMTPLSSAAHTAQAATEGYSDQPQPLGSYLTLMGVFGAFVTGMIGAVRFSGTKLPAKAPAAGDLLLLGVATHKLARLITKDAVTSALRAPFVRLKEESAGEGEVEEEARGEGMQRALGDLLTCPFCIGVWIATPMWFGMLLAPRLTRFVAGILATITGADFMHQIHVKVKDSIDK